MSISHMRKLSQVQHWNLGCCSYLYILNLYQISILINRSNITQVSILLLPQISIDMTQKVFLGLQENSSLCVWSLSNCPLTTRLGKTQQPWLLLHSQCFLLCAGPVLSGVWPHPETSGKAILGQQVLRGRLLFQGLVKVKDMAVSLPWEEWEHLDPVPRNFDRESTTKDCGNTISPSKCCDFAHF